MSIDRARYWFRGRKAAVRGIEPDLSLPRDILAIADVEARCVAIREFMVAYEAGYSAGLRRLAEAT